MHRVARFAWGLVCCQPMSIPAVEPPCPVRPLRIGGVTIDPPVILAPMAGFTTYAYRAVVRRLGGVGLVTTEMVSARGLVYQPLRDRRLPERLWGVLDEPRPLAVQIWDNDSEALAAAAARVAHQFHASIVDLNFGCPARNIAEKAQSGSYLLRDPDRVGAIVGRVVAACWPVPVTAKIRLGCTPESISAIEVAQAIEAAGGAAVTVHGRTAWDRFRGRADWDQIAEVKRHVQRIPVIGNGDLLTPEDALRAFRRYGVDGVMIGRAALAKPWIFRQIQAALAGQAIPPDPDPSEQRQILLEHYQLLVERFGPQRATILMRRAACAFARTRPGARAFRAAVCQAQSPESFATAVDQFFRVGGSDCGPPLAT